MLKTEAIERKYSIMLKSYQQKDVSKIILKTEPYQRHQGENSSF